MSGIRSYDLSGDQAESVLKALNGDEAARTLWVGRFQTWIDDRNLQIRIINLIEQWLRSYAQKNLNMLPIHAGWAETDEERIVDWVYYQMEYTSGIQWDKKINKVAINKYASSRPLMKDEQVQELLDYLNREMENGRTGETTAA